MNFCIICFYLVTTLFKCSPAFTKIETFNAEKTNTVVKAKMPRFMISGLLEFICPIPISEIMITCKRAMPMHRVKLMNMRINSPENKLISLIIRISFWSFSTSWNPISWYWGLLIWNTFVGRNISSRATIFSFKEYCCRISCCKLTIFCLSHLRKYTNADM